MIIDHKAARVRQAIFVQQFLSTGIHAHLKPLNFQYELKRISDGRVIINYKNHLLGTNPGAQLIDGRMGFPTPKSIDHEPCAESGRGNALYTDVMVYSNCV